MPNDLGCRDPLCNEALNAGSLCRDPFQSIQLLKRKENEKDPDYLGCYAGRGALCVRSPDPRAAARYLVGGPNIKSNTDLLAVTDKLVAKARAERAAKK